MKKENIDIFQYRKVSKSRSKGVATAVVSITAVAIITGIIMKGGFRKWEFILQMVMMTMISGLMKLYSDIKHKKENGSKQILIN